MPRQHQDIDGGYAWVVLAASFTIQCIAGIMAYCPGIINIGIMEEIDNDLSKTSWIGSTFYGTFTLLGPVAGLILKKVGPRATAISGGIITLLSMTASFFCDTVVGLIITFGLLAGFGMCLAGNVVGVAPGLYFDKKRPLAYGTSMAGGALGILVAGPMTKLLLDKYSVHGTLLLLGAISFHVCVAGAIIRPRPKKIPQELVISSGEETSSLVVIQSVDVVSEKLNAGEPEEISPLKQKKEDKVISEEKSLKEIGINACARKASHKCLHCPPRSILKRYISFSLYSLSVTLWSLSEGACVFHLPNYAAHKGSTPKQASTLFIALGTGSMCSRILTGCLATNPFIGNRMMNVGLIGIAGVLTLFFPLFSGTYVSQFVFSALYGVYAQGINGLMGPITIELIGLRHLPVGYGIVYFSCGIGLFLGAPTASLIYRLSGEYDTTYYFGGMCFILSSIISASTSMILKEELQS